MRNAKCGICGHVRGTGEVSHCPACGARSVFAIPTNEAVSPLPQRRRPVHGALFFPSRGACLSFD
jgi:hypothetical protein